MADVQLRFKADSRNAQRSISELTKESATDATAG